MACNITLGWMTFYAPFLLTLGMRTILGTWPIEEKEKDNAAY